jgi:hypothetical protein
LSRPELTSFSGVEVLERHHYSEPLWGERGRALPPLLPPFYDYDAEVRRRVFGEDIHSFAKLRERVFEHFIPLNVEQFG